MNAETARKAVSEDVGQASETRYLRLRLVSVSFAAVEFVATFQDGSDRQVLVDVKSGRDWLRSVLFPGYTNETSQSLGDDELDRQVRERAAEELTRLEAAVNIASGRWAA